jgi:hypothetical protein
VAHPVSNEVDIGCGLHHGKVSWSVKLTTQFHLMTILRMCETSMNPVCLCDTELTRTDSFTF